MSQHSPGPWSITYGQTSCRIIGADGYAVAAVRAKYPRVQSHCEIRNANARLIVDAPTLLTTLEELVLAGDMCVTSHDDIKSMVRFGRAVDQARDLLRDHGK